MLLISDLVHCNNLTNLLTLHLIESLLAYIKRVQVTVSCIIADLV